MSLCSELLGSQLGYKLGISLKKENKERGTCKQVYWKNINKIGALDWPNTQYASLWFRQSSQRLDLDGIEACKSLV